ncbi:MAG: type II secretion system F family protein [Planctomycetota bacterium]|jgi:type II secretory pathway component PulF
MKLAYCAYDKSGRQVTDTIEAPDPEIASETLRRRGLYILEIGETTGSFAKSAGRSRTGLGYARRLKNVAVFTRQLSVLISSGTPVVEALAAFERQVNPGPWQNTISNLRLRVEEGASLSEAMAGHAEYFDSAYRSLVAAGESSGKLAVMLERLASLKRKQLHVRNSVIGSLIYPILLMAIAIVVLVLLLSFVVPRFAGLFDTLDVPLPASTRVLVVVSGAFRSYWWLMLGMLAGSAIALKTYVKTPAGKHAWDTAVLRLPKVGSIIKSFAIARITRLLGVLLDGHVPMLEALRLTTHASSNVHYRELMNDAEELVSRGEPLYSAFTNTELVSPSVCEAIRNGEQSGQLSSLLLNISDFFDDENEVVLRSLTSIIEPVILIVLGLLVGVVAISMFLPLFDLTSMIEGGG